MRRLVENEDRLAWIFGSSRSGSTWLLRMLSELRGVVPVDDPHLGHHLGVWRPIPLAWAACEEPPKLSTLLDIKVEEPGYFFADRYRDAWWQPLRELIAARFEAQAEECAGGLSAAELFVVKEPGSQVAPLLTELFPASKLIFLLRDGRDVVDSWLDAYRKGSWAIPGSAFAVAPEGRVALIRWLSAVWVYRSQVVLEAFESRPPENRILIRYEELREETAPCLQRLCAMLGLEQGQLSEVVSRHCFEEVPAEARGPRQAVRRANPGGWRQNLTAEERIVMEEVLGESLAKLGYHEAFTEQSPAPV
jgi:Sulfotransferase family